MRIAAVLIILWTLSLLVSDATVIAALPVGTSSWVQVLPTGNLPPPRAQSYMAYDGQRHNVVLFGGGVNGNYLNDTWIWNGRSWIKASPVRSPSPRCCGQMTYDPVSHLVVLFGGYNDGNHELADTWTWDGNSWTLVCGDERNLCLPHGRNGQGMVYDETIRKIVMFGGGCDTADPSCFGRPNLADTWTWNGSSKTWAPVCGTRSVPACGPGIRHGLAMAYDATNATIVLFGGYNTSCCYQDTWVWNGGSRWTRASPVRSPSGRDGPSMAFDPRGQDVVLFGGYDRGQLGDTWTWRGGNWTQQAPANHPSPRSGVPMVYDDADGYVLIFGGGQQLNDTWAWRGQSTPRLQQQVRTPSAQTRNLTFVATGLPAPSTATSLAWTVTVNGASQTTSQNSITFQEPVGSYQYQVASSAEYAPTPSSGTLTLNGNNVTVLVSFRLELDLVPSLNPPSAPTPWLWTWNPQYPTTSVQSSGTSNPQVGLLTLGGDLWNLSSLPKLSAGSVEMSYGDRLAAAVDFARTLPKNPIVKIVGYPNIEYGHNLFATQGNTTAQRPLSIPMLVNQLPDFIAVTAYSISDLKPAGLPMDFSYDIWLTNDQWHSTGVGGPGVVEIMVWLYESNLSPASDLLSSPTSVSLPTWINGSVSVRTWNIYVCKYICLGHPVVSMVLSTPVKSGAVGVDIPNFISEALAVLGGQEQSSSYYLEAIDLGSEFGYVLPTTAAIFDWNLSHYCFIFSNPTPLTCSN